MKPKKRRHLHEELPIFEKGRKAQPASLFAVFSIVGITVLFLTIMVMFALSSPTRHLGLHEFPWLFYLSTPIIIACSYTIEKTKLAFRTDNASALMKFQSWTLAISISFCIVQFFAWRQLWNSGITMQAVSVNGVREISNSGAYLFVLSGLHVLHLLGGLCFLFFGMFRMIHQHEDLVKSVVYFSDKREGGRISALALYWHFLGALWCVMFLFFLWCFI